MPVTIRVEAPDLWFLRVSGVLHKRELETAQTAALETLEPTTQIKMLILLEQFAGWARGEDWGDVSFFFKYGNQAAKIAIVGDSKWEGEMLVFLGAGLRRAPVKYFPTGQEKEARTWLSGPQ